MGYYDEERVRREQQGRSRRPKVWLSSLVSAMIGGLIVLLFVPALADTGLFSDESEADEVEVISDTEQESVPAQQSQVEVSSEVTEAVERVSDAIVGVVNIQEGPVDFFQQDSEDMEAGVGSGVIFEQSDGEAKIITNYHVIDGADDVEISLPNGERETASLIGADPLSDLAVLSISDDHVQAVAEFGDSDVLNPGEPAIAIGNPVGLHFSRTVTQGVISGMERSIPVVIEDYGQWEMNVLQTDAAINPGNSGGALINIQGQVIGINSLKLSRPGGEFGGGMSQAVIEGMGFAIPINDVIPVIEDLIEKGEVQRPQLGVQVVDLAAIDSRHWQETLNLPEDIHYGVFVQNIVSGSPADEAGLEQLDVIVEMDGEEIENGVSLRKVLYTKDIGDTLEVSFYREGIPMTEEVELTAEMGLPAGDQPG